MNLFFGLHQKSIVTHRHLNSVFNILFINYLVQEVEYTYQDGGNNPHLLAQTMWIARNII